MSSKRAIRRRACKGKQRHSSAGGAHAAMACLGRSKSIAERDRMSVYPCRFCGGFHFGHTPARG